MPTERMHCDVILDVLLIYDVFCIYFSFVPYITKLTYHETALDINGKYDGSIRDYYPV